VGREANHGQFDERHGSMGSGCLGWDSVVMSTSQNEQAAGESQGSSRIAAWADSAEGSDFL